MIINEILLEEPQCGDSIDIEFGDILIESVIEEVTSDGVVIRLDETAMRLMIESKQQLDEITRRGMLRGLGGLAIAGIAGDAMGKVTLGQPVLTMKDEENGTLLYQGKQIPVLNLFKKGVNVRTMTQPIKANYNNKLINVIVVSDDKAYIQSSEKFNPFQQNEAEYQGRKVPLGKPMKGDVKKSKVYVKGPNGNVVKVNFGDKNMRIKKSNPKRRKSFRARHNCANPGPRWRARYWSCRAW